MGDLIMKFIKYFLSIFAVLGLAMNSANVQAGTINVDTKIPLLSFVFSKIGYSNKISIPINEKSVAKVAATAAGCIALYTVLSYNCAKMAGYKVGYLSPLAPFFH